MFQASVSEIKYCDGGRLRFIHPVCIHSAPIHFPDLSSFEDSINRTIPVKRMIPVKVLQQIFKIIIIFEEIEFIDATHIHTLATNSNITVIPLLQKVQSAYSFLPLLRLLSCFYFL